MSPDSTHRGFIAWMARNHVAVNLLVALLVLGGIIGAFSIRQEVYPEYELDTVAISVPYPGASPEETEQGIVLAIEEAVRGVDGVKRVTSTAAEGSGVCAVELLHDADAYEVLANVKNAVDRITSFPENAERPTVQLISRRSRVISLVITGERDLSELHQIAEMTRDELLSLEGITQVEIEGVPPLEIAIEVPRAALESYGITLAQIAAEVRAASVELPGGAVKTPGGEVLVRVADRRQRADEFAELILRSSVDGAKVRLGDIATITDGYAETDNAAYYNGQRAVRVTAYRIGEETPTSVAVAVNEYAPTLQARVPQDISIVPWQDESERLRDRIDLLTGNAQMGFLLVVLLLSLFLRLRLALRVAVSIPLSFLGTFLLMPVLGISINMISTFALIISLGILVDNAIIIGENVYFKINAGMSQMRAVITGTKEMLLPVTTSVLTTMIAFIPMLFIPGTLGQTFKYVPLVVIAVLAMSLVESFGILPAHLYYVIRRDPKDGPKKRHPIRWVQDRVNALLTRFIRRIYEPFLRRLLNWRYLVISLAIASLMLGVGYMQSGQMPFKLFPQLESDRIHVAVELPPGTALTRTYEVRRILETSARQTIDEIGDASILRGMYTMVGSAPMGRRGAAAGAVPSSGSHLLTVEMSLTSADEREIGAHQIAQMWNRNTPPIPGLKTITFKSQTGPSAGAAVDVLLSHRDPRTLEDAAHDLTERLKGYAELTDFENTAAQGKEQMSFQLLPEGRALGLTSQEIATQIRSAFYGREAIREQRGRNELKVMVRYPKPERESEFDLEQLQIRTPEGGHVPLSYVAHIERDRSPTSIRREEGRRVVNVKAELKPAILSPATVIAALHAETLPALIEKYPGLTYEMAGEQREQAEMLGALGHYFAIAMAIMFALIAVPFRSYIQPVIVMSSIPFGFVGALLGHILLGYNFTLMSLFGLVALAGVVVNNAIVLVEATNRIRDGGVHPREAIVEGAMRRLRPILLTSLTTFLGLMPMILERSLQARFLIPMAISLGFGVMFATFITLLIVPSLYLIVEDVRGLFGFHWERVSADSEDDA